MQGPELFDDTSSALMKMMEMTVERHRVISNNLANVNRSGYKRRVLEFEDELAKLVKRGDSGKVGKLRGEIVTDTESPGRPDGNNVNIATETNDLLQNTMMNQLLTRALKTKMNIMKTAIMGAR